MTKGLRFVENISSLSKSEFETLTKDLNSPFINYDFLSSLELSKCVTSLTGWQPNHLISNENNKLNGFMPLYLKDNSQGEFVFDHSWSYALNRAGRKYYPKLLSAIPFTPCESEKIIGNKLSSSQQFDIAIIGGGLSGVSVAFHCAKLGLKACLLEKQTIGWGASGRNGGQVIPGLKELPEQVLTYFGEKMGKKIIALAGAAPDYVFDLIKNHKIDCSASQNGWIQASITNVGLDTNKSLVRQWKEQDAPVELLSTPEIRSLIGSDTYSSGILDLRGGKLHPLNYVIGLAQEAQNAGIPIFQECPVTSIKSKDGSFEINCPEGSIIAEKVEIRSIKISVQ